MSYNESSFFRKDLNILNILLFDRSASKDLVWATSMYKLHGDLYKEDGYIRNHRCTRSICNHIRTHLSRLQSAQ